MHLKINNNYLAIRGVPFEGKLITVSLGLSDNDANRTKVEKQIERIKDALQKQKFDFAAWFPLSTHLQKQREQVAQAAKVAEQRTGTTLREFIPQWLEIQRLSGIVDESFAVCKHNIDHVLADKKLADLPMSKITDLDVLQFRDRLKEKKIGLTKDDDGNEIPRRLKASQVNKVINRLRSVFKYAVHKRLDDGSHMLAESPIEFKNLREQKSKVDPFDEREAHAIIEAAPANGWFRVYLTIALFAGLRPSEILALTWNDIDWNRKIIMVTKTDSRSGIRQPKTSAGERDVEMTDLVRGTLERWRTHQRQEALAGNVLNPDELLFPTSTGNIMPLSNLRSRDWKNVMTRARIDGKPLRRRTLYQCRHTFACMALTRNADIRWLAKQMGHGNINMVITVYSRWLPDERSQRREIAAAPEKLTA